MTIQKNNFPQRVIEFYRENGRCYPWRNQDTKKFTLLLTEILLQQTHAKQVESIWDEFSEWNPKSLREMEKEEIQQVLEPLGFSRKRSKWFKKIGEQVDKVPENQGKLKKLPGVSDYTANAVLCFGFGKRVPIYDVNVERVLNEAFPDEQGHDELLWELLPEDNYRDYNFGLIDLGSALKQKENNIESLLGS